MDKLTLAFLIAAFLLLIAPAQATIYVGGETGVPSISEASEKEKDNLRLSLRKRGLSSITKMISTGEGIEQTALRSWNKRMEVARSRKIFCQLAVKKLGYSGAEVARYLGITTSAVNRMANAEDLPKVRQYIKLL